MFRITTWNVNGVRKNVANIASLLEHSDILCLQETRYNDTLPLLEKEFPSHDHFVNIGIKSGYSGTSISIRKRLFDSCTTIPVKFHPIMESEGRAVCVKLDDNIHVVSLYSPNSGRELVRLPLRVEEFEPSLNTFIQSLPGAVIIVGDFNVAPEAIDIFSTKNRAKAAGFTKEERECFKKLINDTGLVDSFRRLHPSLMKYSYWSNMHKSRAKNNGWRIDHILTRGVDAATCDVMTDVMGSDHVPVYADIPRLQSSQSRQEGTSSARNLQVGHGADTTCDSECLDRVRVRLRAHQLRELDLVEEKPTAAYGARAYENVLQQLSQLKHFDINTKIPGVGEKIATVIRLAVTKKTDTQLSRALLNRARNVEKLVYLPGIGAKKAMELVNDKKWMLKLNEGQRLALKHLSDLRQRIPRHEMLVHEKVILAATLKKTAIAGSFRRGAQESGDIDVLTLDAELSKKLREQNYIIGVLADGKEKFMGMCRLDSDNKLRRIDIEITSPEKWGLALMYFTGSREFNIKIRTLAKNKGMLLSEHELKGSNIREFYEEEDVFNALGEEFVSPKDR